jgi:hypothetical protein
MIVGEDFAWGHMGKTGGDATYILFQCLPDLIVRAHPPEDPEKHKSFREAGETDKKLVLNMRRLPGLVLSYVHHARRYGLGTDFPKGTVITPAEAVFFPRPERMIRNHTDDGRLAIHRWLRMERLREDFLGFAATLRPLAPAETLSIRRAATKSPMDYDHDVRNFFTDAQIEALYRNNPTWTHYEELIYGDVPVSVPAA